VIAVAVAIYLFDCVVLLERGQALWTKSGMAFGSLHYQVRGKVVALLNPLTPFSSVLRTLPPFPVGPGIEASKAMSALSPLAALSALQLMLIFVVLPWCLFRAPGWPFFAALLLAYLNASLLLALIAWRLGRAGISRRPLVALGFGWLACLPLSINSVRKAGLAFDSDRDARKQIDLMPAEKKERARADYAAQLDEAINDLEDDDERRLALALMKGELDGSHGRL
jgi:hypothetical protein